MFQTKQIEARRPIRVGDHVDYVGMVCAVYAGLVVDVAENGDMVVAAPGARDALFDPRMLRISRPR